MIFFLYSRDPNVYFRVLIEIRSEGFILINDSCQRAKGNLNVFQWYNSSRFDQNHDKILERDGYHQPDLSTNTTVYASCL